MLYGIQPHELQQAWEDVGELVSKAAARSRGKYTGEDILKALQTQDAQLWIWRTDTALGVLVTQIVNYPQNRCCWVRIATGHNAREWANPSMRRIEAWAKANGCNAMELIARPGWMRILEGYDMTHLYLERTL